MPVLSITSWIDDTNSTNYILRSCCAVELQCTCPQALESLWRRWKKSTATHTMWLKKEEYRRFSNKTHKMDRNAHHARGSFSRFRILLTYLTNRGYTTICAAYYTLHWYILSSPSGSHKPAHICEIADFFNRVSCIAVKNIHTVPSPNFDAQLWEKVYGYCILIHVEVVIVCDLNCWSRERFQTLKDIHIHVFRCFLDRPGFLIWAISCGPLMPGKPFKSFFK